jgi:uncharacterized protein (TIGR00255 family)
MTGAGLARGATSIGEVTVEVRAVNGRGLALKSRLPSDLQAVEREIERAVRACLERGTVTVWLRVERVGGLITALDESEFERAAARLKELATRCELAPVTVRDVVTMPGVVRSPTEVSGAEIWKELAPLVDDALRALVAEREREGGAALEAMREVLDGIETGRHHIGARAPELQAAYRERLLGRVEEFLEARGLTLTAADVVREVAVYADRVAIDEELQRLDAHLDRVRELLEQGGPVGRRLEFMLQEVLREVNTIGSKSPDVEIAHEVVALKAGVDKLKEQAANIE